MRRGNDEVPNPPLDGTKWKVIEVGEGSGQGGREVQMGERKTADASKREFMVLPDDSEDEGRPRRSTGSHSIFEQTTSRTELGRSWQRAIDNAARGEGSVEAGPVVNRSVPDHVVNRPGTSSENEVIQIDDDDDDNTNFTL